MSNYPDFWRGSFISNPFKEMDRFLEDWATRKEFKTQALSPKCEVTEDRNQYLFKLEVPGIPKDQIKIEFHDQMLSISGERKIEKKDENKKEHLTEFSYGSFLRSFTIPGPVHSENIQASYDHGILQITVPKSEVTKPKQIAVK